MKAMNQRQSRVAEEVRHVVAPALLRGDLPSTLPLSRFTVTAVWISGDLRVARIFLDFPDDLNPAETLATADAELAFPLRKLLAKTLASKNAPAVSFHHSEDVFLPPV